MLLEGTVRDSILGLVDEAPKRYSDLLWGFRKLDKTIFVNLRALHEAGLVTRIGDKYEITKMDGRELRRQNLRRLVDIWVELGADESLPIAEMWDQEYLWRMWIDPMAPHYEGTFPEEGSVIKEFAGKQKHRLVYWQERLWMFSLESTTDEVVEFWNADPFRDSVGERTAQLCVEADVLLLVAG